MTNFQKCLSTGQVPVQDVQQFVKWLKNGPLDTIVNFDHNNQSLHITRDHCGCGCSDHLSHSVVNVTGDTSNLQFDRNDD
jgi:hypothetical protein